MEPRSRALLATLAVLVGALAFLARSIHDQRIASALNEPERGWFSPDPDSLYHMRRVERALDEGLPPAESDPRMNFPHGAAIPWPPYYTYVAYAAAAPFAPSEPEERARFVEMRVASLPRLFGSLTSILAALIAWRAMRGNSIGARAFAAAASGGLHAWMGASLQYSGAGNGDHHAWVTLLLAAMLGGAMHALDQSELESRPRSARNGALLGVVAGVMIGSWVGGMAYAALVELALGAALVAHARRVRAGLPALGVAFHLAWLAAVAPAVATSPWKHEQPWMTVNLSWLHLAHPLLGALVFAPLAAKPAKDALRRAWPAVVGAVGALAALAIAFGDFALARGVREGFAWAARSNEFMAFITESQPLGWGRIGGIGPIVRQLGYGALLAPVAVAWIAWRAWSSSRLDLSVLAIAAPLLATQALVQQRFADAFGPVQAIVIALAVATWTEPLWSSRATLAAGAGLVFGLVMQFPTLRATPARIEHGWTSKAGGGQRARRELHRWIAARTAGEPMSAVLAAWDQGHAIEWAARRASIATNFGSYVGADSYLDPWRFFLEEDPRTAEALLERRRARHVLVTGDFTSDLEVMLRLLRPEERRSYLLVPEKGPVWVSQHFFPTMAARLMMNGRVGDMEKRTLVGDSLDFARLVHVSPHRLAAPPPVRHTNAPVPAGWVWERVAGARLALRGAPGEAVRVSIDVEYAAAQHVLEWVASAAIDASGEARVRVPYCTDAANGDGVSRGPARWSVGSRSGVAVIPASAVEAGSEVSP